MIILFLFGLTVSCIVLSDTDIQQSSLPLTEWGDSYPINLPAILVDTLLVADIRVSCDSVEKDPTTTFIKPVSLYRTRMAYTGVLVNPFMYNEYKALEPTRTVNAGAKYKVFAPLDLCMDTTVKVERVPYADHVGSAQRISTTSTSQTTWERGTAVTYRNLSSTVSESDVDRMLKGVRAEYTQNEVLTRYVVKSPEGGLAGERYISEGLAQGARDSWCGGKAMIVGKLIYTEYDACVRNNKVVATTIDTTEVCGYSKPELYYSSGPRAPYPMWCRVGSTWTWE